MAPMVCCAVNVKDFGAKGDGKTDDTDAINAAIAGAVDGIVEFPRGSYRITQSVEIDLSQGDFLGLSGKGGSARIIMEAAGPAFRFNGSNEKALPSLVTPITWEKERMPLVEGLEIVGAHKDADGIEFHKIMQPILRALLIREVRNGLHFTSADRNIIIMGCHIYNTSGIGIYLDNVNIHQMIISASHISYCKGGGIKVVGSQIRNFQITGNDIEYNFDLDKPASADIWIDCSEGGVVREGTISGNTIQAAPSPGGANIRFTGPSGNSNKVGLWSITGNYISNQEVNILLENSRGVNITGNTFQGGFDRHIVINDSRNIIAGNNVFDRNADYFKKVELLGGISVNRGRNIVLNANIFDSVNSGSMQQGGVIEIADSREVTIEGCHIVNPKFRGISIAKSANVRVTNCIINEDADKKRMLASIVLNGECPGTVVRDNSVALGSQGDVDNQTAGAIVDSNITIEHE